MRNALSRAAVEFVDENGAAQVSGYENGNTKRGRWRDDRAPGGVIGTSPPPLLKSGRERS